MRPRRYATLYERIVANSVLEHEDNPASCWLWTGATGNNGYPRLCVRNADGQPRQVAAHRAMLEEVHDVWFPHDEGGHRCYNILCVNPMHLEIQTRAQNVAEQRNVAVLHSIKPWIPVLYPRCEIDPPFDWPVSTGTVEAPTQRIAA